MKSKTLTLVLSLMILVSSAIAQQNIIRSETHIGNDENGTWRVSKTTDGNGTIVSYDSSYTQHKDRINDLLSNEWSDTTFQDLSQRFKMDLGNLIEDPSNFNNLDPFQNGTDLFQLFKNEDFTFPNLDEMMAELNQFQEKMFQQHQEEELETKDPKEKILRNATDM